MTRPIGTEVCFPLDGLGKSGGSRVVIAIANALGRSGFEPVLQIPDYGGELPFPLDPTVRVDVVPTRLPGAAGKLEYHVKLVLRASRTADALVATSFRTPWLITLSCLVHRSHAARLYLVQHYETHSQGWNAEGSFIKRAARALVAETGYRLPFRRVAVSSWIRDQLPHPADVEVVPNGVDLDVFKPGPAPDPETRPCVVGCIGRRGPTKGWDVFVRALDLLDPAEYRVRVATPDGPERVRLEPGRAQMVHPRDDAEMAAFYRGLHVFVFPSLLEGFGLPVLEAMASGVPVVTADCGGIGDFVTERNALIVPPGDPAALALAVQRIGSDAALRQRLRHEGLETARQSSLAAVLARHVAIVERELSCGSSAP